MTSQTITREEVAEVLRAAIRGEIEVDDLSHLNWWMVNEPDVKFGRWILILFIEANTIYHIYHAEAPDGRLESFDVSDNDPMALLTHDEKHALDRRLGCPG